LLLDSFPFWPDDVAAGWVLSLLLLESVDDDEASAGALGSVALLFVPSLEAVPFAGSLVVELGSEVVEPAGAGSPGLTTSTTPEPAALELPPVLAPPALDALLPVATRAVVPLPPDSTSND